MSIPIPKAFLTLTTVALLNLASCDAQAVSSRNPSSPALNAASPSSSQTKAVGEEIHNADAFTKSKELRYGGYTARTRYKKAKLADSPDTKQSSELVEASYGILEREGKTVLQFDAGVYNGGLNATSFGLFPFLGGGTKQLIVSQDAPREGRQWVVSLSPRPHVIYDGAAFGVGREAGDMGVVDLDGDGIYEISVPLADFYGFHDWAISPVATPLPEVIFKYDAKAGKYLPANEQFQKYILRGVDAAKSKVHGQEDRESHLADVLSIVLSYVFAGKEREAWEFYESAYKLPDKAEIRKEVEDTLKTQPVYRFMYGKAGRR
jgi:hypothetical protein